jgi:hypothetical protein
MRIAANIAKLPELVRKLGGQMPIDFVALLITK